MQISMRPLPRPSFASMPSVRFGEESQPTQAELLEQVSRSRKIDPRLKLAARRNPEGPFVVLMMGNVASEAQKTTLKEAGFKVRSQITDTILTGEIANLAALAKVDALDFVNVIEGSQKLRTS